VIFERIHLPPELEPSPVNPGEGIFAALDAHALQQPQPFQAYGRVGWRPSGPQGGRILTHRAGLGLIAPDYPWIGSGRFPGRARRGKHDIGFRGQPPGDRRSLPAIATNNGWSESGETGRGGADGVFRSNIPVAVLVGLGFQTVWVLTKILMPRNPSISLPG
jgi:hypothetical protein